MIKSLLRYQVCLILLLAASSKFGVMSDPECDIKHRYDPLPCWLWNLTVAIPDQHFKEKIFSLDITGMKCTHFQVKTISSEYVPSNAGGGAPNPSINTEIADVSATCYGKYHSTGLGGSMQATVDAPPNSAALGMSLTFVSEQQQTFRMATRVSTDGCHANLKVAGLHFSGSISAKIINMFKTPIKKYVSSALSTQLCPVIKTMADDKLTTLIQQADRYMLGLIDKSNNGTIATATQRALQQTQSKDAVQWHRDAPVLMTALNVSNQLVNRYLHKGFFRDFLQLLGLDDDGSHHDCGYFFNGVNGLLKSLTHNGTVHFHIPNKMHALKNISFVVPKFAEVSIHLNDITVHGIDGLDRVQLFLPKGEIFQSNIQLLQGINAVVAMDVEVNSIPGGIFQGDKLLESFHFAFNSSSMNIQGDTQFWINNTRFQKVTANHVIEAIKGDKLDLSCTVYPFDQIRVPHLSTLLDIESVSFTPDTDSKDDTLEKDVDAMLNSFLQLFLTEYSDLVTHAFSGLIDGPVKEKALEYGNKWLNDLAKRHNPTDEICWTTTSSPYQNDTTNATAPADYFNFEHAKIFGVVNRFLNSTLFLDNANQYIQCISETLGTSVDAKSPGLRVGNITIDLSRLSVEHLGTLQALRTYIIYSESVFFAATIQSLTLFFRVAFSAGRWVPLAEQV